MREKELLEIYARAKEEALELGDAQRLLNISCELYKALAFTRILSMTLVTAMLISGSYLVLHFVK